MNMTPIVRPFGLKEEPVSISSHLSKVHIPPHMRKAFIHVEFSEADWELFQRIYENADEAAAAIQVLLNAPPEIQILAMQLIELIKEGESYED